MTFIIAKCSCKRQEKARDRERKKVREREKERKRERERERERDRKRKRKWIERQGAKLYEKGYQYVYSTDQMQGIMHTRFNCVRLQR